MCARVPPPSIPAEALARQGRLQAALQAMAASDLSREPASLQNLRAVLGGGSWPDLDARIEAIVADTLVEEALELLRAARGHAADRAHIEKLAVRLAPLAVKAQQRRSATWQLDTRQVLIRLTYAKEAGALNFDDGDIHALFLQAFRLEGLHLLLDLGKRPRPLLSIGLPLPVGVASLAETMDAALKQEPEEVPTVLMARLNHRLPAGLRIHRWDLLPRYASGLNELALLSHWRWEVPSGYRSQVEAQASVFLAAKAWPWERGSAKADAPLDVRRLVPEMRWEAGALCFTTRMGEFQATNPLKLLGAVFALEPASISGLTRVAIELKADARLNHAERFEPKLKNMYEDAVLLGGGSNIVLVDEDDDEPIKLG